MNKEDKVLKSVKLSKEELYTVIDAVNNFLFEEEYLNLRDSIISKCKEAIKSSN